MSLGHCLLFVCALFVVGACVGSFLNVCLHRLPRGLGLIRPGSRCPRCHAPIAARDNVPVLGWLLLNGRCRHCRAPISPRYPIVEAAIGLGTAALPAAARLATGADLTEMSPALMAAVTLAWIVAVPVAVAAALLVIDRRSAHRRLRLDPGSRLIPTALLGRIAK